MIFLQWPLSCHYSEDSVVMKSCAQNPIESHSARVLFHWGSETGLRDNASGASLPFPLIHLAVKFIRVSGALGFQFRPTVGR